MRSFFKIFFASFLALVVFVVVFFFLLAGYIGGIASKPKVETGSNAVLVLDLSETYRRETRRWIRWRSLAETDTMLRACMM